MMHERREEPAENAAQSKEPEWTRRQFLGMTTSAAIAQSFGQYKDLMAQ